MPIPSIKLHVGSDIVVRTEADCPIVAMLRPASGLAQWLSSETYVFEPWVPTTEYVDSFGNLCQRMVVPRGDMRLRVEATVETEPVLAIEPSAPFTLVQDLPDSALQYLLPSRYCPADRMTAAGTSTCRQRCAGYSQVEAIRRWIQQNLEYRYGSSDASTDAIGTLDERRGRMPGLRPRRHRPDPRAAHPGTHGGRLSAGPGADGPPRLVRGLRRRPLVHLRCDAAAAAAVVASCWPTAATLPTSPSFPTTVP